MTETMASLRRQIDVAEDLQSVVTTMRALAAVNIRQYQEAVDALEEYRRTIEMGLRIALRQSSYTLTNESPSPQRAIAIIVGSDQGLVGQFNHHVTQYAHREMNRWNTGALIATVGLRLPSHLDELGYRIDAALRIPGTRAGIMPSVRDLLLQISAWRQEHEINQLSMFFNRPTSQTSYQPQHVDLLPLDRDWLNQLHEQEWESRTVPTARIEGQRLFEQLIQQHFFASMYFALASSLASENASRLASMENAKRNIDERLDDLQHQYNQRRQESITEELFDVIAGFQMLRED